MNRVWTYACGRPLNAARLCLVERNAPSGWTTNAKDVEAQFHAANGGVGGQVSIQTRHWTYCRELPLAQALDVRETYRSTSDVIRTLIELHYSALTAVRKEARLFFFAKALEIAQAVLRGRTRQQKQGSLPPEIRDDLDQSLNWLFRMANTRCDVRHVVQERTPPTLHPRMSPQELQSFRHDADLVIRTVVCMNLGHEPFLMKEGTPQANSA